jgi:spore coat polysaccharide biosynthesis predicted glycosyltransferase SpsG
MNKILIITDIGKKVGLGHYSRSKIITKEIKQYFKRYSVKNLYFSEQIKDQFINQKTLNTYFEIISKIKSYIPEILILNNSLLFQKKYGLKLINELKKNFKKTKMISIDGYLNLYKHFQALWIPNIMVPKKYHNINKIYYGWDKLILDKKKNLKKKLNKKILLISHGGSDIYRLTKKLPNILYKTKYHVNWIIGPYTNTPNIKQKFKNKIKVINQPKSIDKFIVNSHISLALFGMSFFENIRYSLPTIVLIPPGKENKLLIDYILKQKIIVIKDVNQITRAINKLMSDFIYYKKLFIQLSKKTKLQNRKKFYKKIFNYNY